MSIRQSRNFILLSLVISFIWMLAMIYEVSNYTDPRESARFHPRFFPSATLPVSSVPTVRPIHSVLFETKITTQKDEQNESQRKIDNPRIVVPVVNLTELGVIHNADEQRLKDEGYSIYAYNSYLSDRIGPRRQIPDSRHELCRKEKYPEDLPSASIIICYYNEAPSALIRMVNSIIDRTPDQFIHEILLVDDSSDLNDSDTTVDSYLREHWQDGKVRMYRTEHNEGLIRAKLFGAERASGEVLIFLDSHCEVNQQWIEPLLNRIKQNNHTVVCPIIDIIDYDTMKYIAAPVCKGGMSWSLLFKWDYPPPSYFNDARNNVRPLKSPTMAGGLFAVDRQYFKYLGGYDKGMDIWGAENVEFSMRIWLCGGQLEIIPCSRVGHIFRKRRPYGTGIDSYGRNAARAANVWLDDYIEKFYMSKPNLKNKSFGDISEMQAIKKRLNCRPFSWFIENIYPELKSGNSPSAEQIEKGKDLWLSHPSDKYQIMLKNTTLCMAGESHVNRLFIGSRIFLQRCKASKKHQVWRWTKFGELRPMGSSSLCLDSLKDARLLKCHQQGAHQSWIFVNGSKLYNAAVNHCVHGTDELSSIVSMKDCSKASEWVIQKL
ncbi:hypothetical protein AB6A40_008721 [Gnathostoma spinigerum]|uniref:Polypeptide N-acetylgalactosaminyltransferase n=1 Tax=Gnathostoma spinigerum TaxID=75299 RepID=A0ABD6EZD5_9BILA